MASQGTTQNPNPLPHPNPLISANFADLWDEIASEEQQQQQQQSNPNIAVVYGRRRAEVPNPSSRNPILRSGREPRVSFVPGKRPSWNRSLSTRGRESIVVAPGADLRPQPKPKAANKRPPRPRKAAAAAQAPPDLSKEKAYFEEVDAFELVEESPSPKNFVTWAMGREHDLVVHDLAAILERWKILKSRTLFMETPVIPSVQSSNHSCSLNERTPERPLQPRGHLRFTSNTRDTTAVTGDGKPMGGFNESSVIASFDALSVKEGFSRYSEGLSKEVPLAPRTLSLGEECLSAFTQLLLICRQSAPLSLSDVFCAYCEPGSIVKLGEGTYGEAFRAGETVCKVVPLDGDLLVNGEVQKKSAEVLEEVLLCLTLNNLRPQPGEENRMNACTSFIETKGFRLCQGSYDPGLICAWEDWDTKHGSENDHPKEFSEEQCYIVFVLADGGKDLESFVLLNFDEARSLLIQTTAALAVAEAACEFEHRDLHWGNILLTRNEATTIDFTLQGRKISTKTFGLTISIIDFTLSRINTGEAILFLDLSDDPALFEGPKGDRQAETYRKMKEVTEECWEGSFPKTNVLWIIYLVDILLTKKSYRQKLATKDERELRSFKKRLNSFDSAQESLADGFFSDLLVDQIA